MDLKSEISRALKTLNEGGILLYPTDTIWGIGCDATNAKAVDKIFSIKKRGAEKSMIILLDDILKLKNYIQNIPNEALSIIETTERPLTIIYPSVYREKLAANVLAEDGSIAVRVTKDPFCKSLVQEFGKPIVSTSANVSGENPPANFSEISDEIKRSVDSIVQYRQEEKTSPRPSAIIRIGKSGEIEFIRK